MVMEEDISAFDRTSIREGYIDHCSPLTKAEKVGNG